MKLDPIALGMLRRLQEAGVCLYVGMPTGGNVDLTPEQALEFLQGERLFWAKQYGVEVNVFSAWLDARDTGTTCAKNANGKRCSNWVPAGESPSDFNPDGGLCLRHQPFKCMMKGMLGKRSKKPSKGCGQWCGAAGCRLVNKEG